MRGERIWVNGDFKKKLKEMAVSSDKTVIELTGDLAKSGEGIRLPNEKKKKNSFRLNFP